MSSEVIKEISEAHARLRRLEDELMALRSQLRPAKKRIAAARAELDALITELASGQSSLPLFRTEAADNGLAPQNVERAACGVKREENPTPHDPRRTPHDSRGRRKKGATP
jgi:chromosome segregation ATPase